jgi:hypothetical protein
MSMILCDYRAEARAAAQMADTATSEVDRSDWLFLALANLSNKTRLLRATPKISHTNEIECFGAR